MMTKIVLSDEELLEILETRIPALLERRPDLWRRVYSAWMDTFAKREEVAAIMVELRQLSDRLTSFEAATTERFDHLDERMGKFDERMGKFDERMDKFGERMDKFDERMGKFDERMGKFDERMGKFDERMEKFGAELADTRAWFELTVGRLQTRAGRNLEDVVASALRIGLKRPDVRADMIKLRQKIVDREGIVYKPGQQKEVDLVASNGEYLVFEVKSAAKPGDVDDFAEKVTLLRHIHPEKQVRGVFITLAPEADVQQRCRELGIELAPTPQSA